MVIKTRKKKYGDYGEICQDLFEINFSSLKY